MKRRSYVKDSKHIYRSMYSFISSRDMLCGMPTCPRPTMVTIHTTYHCLLFDPCAVYLFIKLMLIEDSVYFTHSGDSVMLKSQSKGPPSIIKTTLLPSEASNVLTKYIPYTVKIFHFLYYFILCCRETIFADLLTVTFSLFIFPFS